jgi:hypothetical protein
MTTEKKRLYAMVGWGALFTIPLWSTLIWAFRGGTYLLSYWVVAFTCEIMAAIMLFYRDSYLFNYFVIGLLAYFPSMVLGLVLITGSLLILAFGGIVSPTLIMTFTLLFFATYCFFPLKYYYDDYHKTEKDRLKSFDFEEGTYDITNQSLMRGDAFADYYTKSVLSKAYSGVIKLHLLFPISGGAIAIIAGNISKNLQLGIGLVAAFLATITFIQFGIPGFFNAWQVRQIERRHGKKIRILWGDEEEY